MSKNTTRNLIRARLLEHGTNIRAWSFESGYKEGMVAKTLSRYINKDKRPPEGTKSLEVISKLEAITGIKICG